MPSTQLDSSHSPTLIIVNDDIDVLGDFEDIEDIEDIDHDHEHEHDDGNDDAGGVSEMHR